MVECIFKKDKTLKGDRMTTKTRVFALVADQLGVNEEEIKLESRFIEDLGADSLDIVELIMAMEEEFETEIPDEEAEKILTVGDTVKYIEDHK